MAYDGKTVDLEVRTRDTWTLNPGINFSRQGGANSSSIRSRGKEPARQRAEARLRLVQRRRPRVADNFEFFDPHFHSTWTRLGVAYSDADDGSTKALRVDGRSMRSTRAMPAAATCTTRSARSLATPTAMRVGKFENDEQFAEALLRVVERLAGRLGAPVDGRRDLPSATLSPRSP